MTCNIIGRSLLKEKHVTSKSFSGCTADDMFDFVKPFIRCEPDEIILHLGTNNLSTDEPQQLGEKIIDLAGFIEPQSPSTKLAAE